MPRRRLDEPNFKLKLQGDIYYVQWTSQKSGKTVAVSCNTTLLNVAKAFLARLKKNPESYLGKRKRVSGNKKRCAIVYVLTNEANSLIKIGYAVGKGGAERRMAQFQMGCPVRLSLHGIVLFENLAAARAAEASIHRALKSSRMMGEWFAADPDVVLSALNQPDIIVRIGKTASSRADFTVNDCAVGPADIRS